MLERQKMATNSVFFCQGGIWRTESSMCKSLVGAEKMARLDNWQKALEQREEVDSDES